MTLQLVEGEHGEQDVLERIFSPLAGAAQSTRVLVLGAFFPESDRTPAWIAERGFQVKVFDVNSNQAYWTLYEQSQRIGAKVAGIPRWHVWRWGERRRLARLAQATLERAIKFNNPEHGSGDGLAHVTEWQRRPHKGGGTIKFWYGDFLQPHRWLTPGCMDIIFCRGSHHWMTEHNVDREAKPITLMLRYVKPGGKIVLEFQDPERHYRIQELERLEKLERLCQGKADVRLHVLRSPASQAEALGRYHYRYVAEITRQ